MSELLFDDIFKVDDIDPDGKKYDKGMCSYFSSFWVFSPLFSILDQCFPFMKLPQNVIAQSSVKTEYGQRLQSYANLWGS